MITHIMLSISHFVPSEMLSRRSFNSRTFLQPLCCRVPTTKGLTPATVTGCFPFHFKQCQPRTPLDHCECPALNMSSYFESINALLSSSLPNSPKLLICPAFGAFSRGCCDSFFRYAACNAVIFAAWAENLSATGHAKVEQLTRSELTSFLWCKHS